VERDLAPSHVGQARFGVNAIAVTVQGVEIRRALTSSWILLHRCGSTIPALETSPGDVAPQRHQTGRPHATAIPGLWLWGVGDGESGGVPGIDIVPFSVALG